jgi:hypothetical protein
MILASVGQGGAMTGIATGGDDAGLQRASRGLAFVAHSYVAHVSACPEVWLPVLAGLQRTLTAD